MRNLKLYLHRIWLPVILFSLAACCIHIEPSHNGTVKDADTLKPINDVDVYAVFEYNCFLPPNPGGNSSEPLGNIGTKTDEKGEYQLPIRIFLKPPLLCGVSKQIGYIKPGYAEDGYHLGHPWDREIPDPQQIKLYKFTHYLDILPYMNPDKYFYSGQSENHPLSYLRSIEAMKHLKFTPTDEKGVFARVPGKQLSRIYPLNVRYYNENMCYIFDDKSQDWILIDHRGKLHESVSPKMPNWLFMATSDADKYNTIYADKSSFYYYKSLGKEVVINIIPAIKGNISDLTGYKHHFMTIENDGKNLCVYGTYLSKQIKNLYDINDLPNFNADNELSDAKFISINNYYDPHRAYYILVKGNNNWHIYAFNAKYDNKFQELITFPLSKEISSCVSGGNSLFIAFNGEGIVKYDIIDGKLKLAVSKFAYLNTIRKEHIKSMAIAYINNLLVLYATTGDDRIFRFTVDGDPDYPVEIVP